MLTRIAVSHLADTALQNDIGMPKIADEFNSAADAGGFDAKVRPRNARRADLNIINFNRGGLSGGGQTLCRRSIF